MNGNIEEKPTEEFCHIDTYYDEKYKKSDDDSHIDRYGWEYFNSETIKKKSWFPFLSRDVGWRTIYRKRTKEQQLEYLRGSEKDYLHSIEAIQEQAEENMTRAKDTLALIQQKITELSNDNIS